ncbi:MAG: hydroxymethylbilane synthase [Fimbriimonas sp.]
MGSRERAIPRLRLGTRGSKLALAQAHAVQSLLAPFGDVEIVTIKTSGDKGDRDRLGAFVREIQESLLREEVDIALHCLKDLPTQEVPGLRLSAHLVREDARDTLITRGPVLMDLPEGAVVGTGSVRRTSQLAAVRPDLVFRPLVGNVDTRLGKLVSGEYDAIVLALAGLRRLGILESWSEFAYAGLSVHTLSEEEMLPAPGQAVLVLETRESDAASHEVVKRFNHEDTEICARAERAFLKAFGGGCSVPVAASGVVEREGLELRGLVASPDGRVVLRGVQAGSKGDWRWLAARLVEELAARGAMDVFKRGAEL